MTHPCITHHICDCLERRMKALEKVAEAAEEFCDAYVLVEDDSTRPMLASLTALRKGNDGGV